jgi:hypothetical protein
MRVQLLTKTVLFALLSFIFANVSFASENRSILPINFTSSVDVSSTCPSVYGFSTGIPIAFANDMIGLQFGLLYTGVADTFYGLQVAPVGSNATKGYGIQFAGFFCESYEFNGIQIGLVGTNMWTMGESVVGTTVTVRGVQIAGLGNVASISVGSQIGLMNGSCELRGLQIGAYNGLEGNVNKPSRGTGLQLGVVNISSGHFNGVQIGLYNFARTLTGVQIGLVNRIMKNSIFPSSIMPVFNMSW